VKSRRFVIGKRVATLPLAALALAATACSGGTPAPSMNFAPMFIDATPAIGTMVQGIPSAVPRFQVVVSDPNAEDDLHIRWIADFPPSTADTRVMISDELIPHRPDGKVIDVTVSLTPDCLTHALATILQHQIMVVVADRPFDDSPPPAGMSVDLTKLADPDGREVIATWTLDLECP
jgi:hypothetical protein